MFSIQVENAIASNSSVRQRPARSDQPSGADGFGALVDSNTNAADTSRPADNHTDLAPRRSTRDDRPVDKTEAADSTTDVRPANQDNSDKTTTAPDDQKQADASGKETSDKSGVKKAAGDKSDGKTKIAHDGEDAKDSANSDQAAVTPTAVIVPAQAIAVAADPSIAQTQGSGAAASDASLLANSELVAAHANGDTQSKAAGDSKIATEEESSALAKAGAKSDPSQKGSAGKADKGKTVAADNDNKPDADDTGIKAAKDDKGTDSKGETKAAVPDKPAPTAHEPRPATQPLTPDPLQTANGQQQPTQLQPVQNTATAPAAQLNATLAAANAPVPLNSLAVDIALKAAGGNSRFEIRLDPAELGRIDVRLDVDKHGQVTSHLTVERPATLDMLRKDAPQLQQALEDAGLKTGDSGLQFSLRDQSSFSGSQDDGQSGRSSQRLIVTEDAPVPAQVAGQTYGRARGSRSGVDISI